MSSPLTIEDLTDRWHADLQHLAVADNERDKLCAYLRLIYRWNVYKALVGRSAPEKWVMRHIADSWSLVPFLRSGEVADVGSGAGLPGIPLAIAFAKKNFTLIERNGKKCAFLHYAQMELSLPNLKIIYAPSEKVHRHFSVVVARAFGSLSALIAAAAHLCAPSGRLLAMKGYCSAQELQSVEAEFISTIHNLPSYRHRQLIEMCARSR